MCNDEIDECEECMNCTNKIHGWICARCGLSISPHMDVCPCSYSDIIPVSALDVWTFAGMMRCLAEE